MALKIKTFNKNNTLVEITEGSEIDRYAPYIFIGEDTNPPANYDARYFNWVIKRQETNVVAFQTLPSGASNTEHNPLIFPVSATTSDLRTNIPYIVELSVTYCYTEDSTALTSTITQSIPFTFVPISYVLVKDPTGSFVSIHEKLIDFKGPYCFQGGIPSEPDDVRGTYKFMIYEKTPEDNYKIVLETQFNPSNSWIEENIELEDNKTYFIEFFFNKFKGEIYNSGKIRFYLNKTHKDPKMFKAFDFHNDIENGVVIGNSVKLMELYANGVNYEWVDVTGEKGIVLKKDGNVHISDKYNLLESDFTLRLWLRELPKQDFVFSRIFKSPPPGGNITDYINLFYHNNRIYADKATMEKQISIEGIESNSKLISQFISRDNSILKASFNSDTDWLFVLIKHKEQKIDLWAEIISEIDPKAYYYAGTNLYARSPGPNWIGKT